MADTLVERLTGQTTAADVNVELQIMMPLESLISRDDPKAPVIPGYGPLPQELAWEILTTSRGRKWWRRLFTAPTTQANRRGPLVGGDPTRRCFDGWLAKLIRLRDQTCRDPYCDAPIRHLDHITRHSDGGATTFDNGRGTCARCNYVREMPGWHIKLIDCGFHTGPHKIIISTPTGHHYLSRAPDPP
ncbi:MAG TPA: HNH endonuclease [Propionibacteriaceae bacterium]|nr:HNH endonuclease [Propionibacteriaceae bacterium]